MGEDSPLSGPRKVTASPDEERIVSEQELDGRHVVVTGAGTGIGRAIALRMAHDGARVSLMGRRKNLLKETAALIGEGGGAEAVVQSVDVRDGTSVEQAFADFREGNFSTDDLVGYENSIPAFLTTPGGAAWWKERQVWFSPTFRLEASRLCSQPPTEASTAGPPQPRSGDL